MLKTAFPTDLVYAPTLEPALRLVTCGGPVDRAKGSYLDNVIVYADPPRSRLRARCAAVLMMVVAIHLAGCASSWASRRQSGWWPQAPSTAADGWSSTSRVVVPPASFSVTVDGRPQPADAVPLLSDRLAMALVWTHQRRPGPAAWAERPRRLRAGHLAHHRTALVADVPARRGDPAASRSVLRAGRAQRHRAAKGPASSSRAGARDGATAA